MAAIDWPLTVAPEQIGYAESPPNTTLFTEMNAGPQKVRLRYTAAPRRFNLTYHLTKAEVATLDAFYATTSLGGTLEFNWTHPRTGDSVEARFVPGKPPNYSAIEIDGVVSVQLEILP
jgi:hypothetical protein